VCGVYCLLECEYERKSVLISVCKYVDLDIACDRP
jgi:hypothetical protein